MHPTTDWKDEKYTETFDETIRGLEARRRISPAFTREELRGILKALYEQEGNDWGGRGPLQDVILDATIAAHEHFLAEWKNDTETKEP